MAKARGKGAPKKKRTLAGMFFCSFVLCSLFYVLLFFLVLWEGLGLFFSFGVCCVVGHGEMRK